MTGVYIIFAANNLSCPDFYPIVWTHFLRMFFLNTDSTDLNGF